MGNFETTDTRSAEATQSIGNPEDGGAMSQQHILRLLLNRSGKGNFTFAHNDKSILMTGDAPPCILTGCLKRRPSSNGMRSFATCTDNSGAVGQPRSYG